MVMVGYLVEFLGRVKSIHKDIHYHYNWSRHNCLLSKTMEIDEILLARERKRIRSSINDIVILNMS